jgi:hypothetical protein
MAFATSVSIKKSVQEYSERSTMSYYYNRQTKFKYIKFLPSEDKWTQDKFNREWNKGIRAGHKMAKIIYSIY